VATGELFALANGSLVMSWSFLSTDILLGSAITAGIAACWGIVVLASRFNNTTSARMSGHMDIHRKGA
jgi:hypothetical protein